MNIGYLYDSLFLKHSEVGHPESPQRLEAILQVWDDSGLFARLTAPGTYSRHG